MPDPITSILTVASEHPQVVAAVASIYGVVKPLLAKLLGPGVDEIGEIGRDYVKGLRAKNISRTLTQVDKMLTDVGIEPQPVPLNILVPLLEAASLEDNPALADLWAALLANAANPAQRIVAQPAFAEVLRQLTPTDALVLETIYSIWNNSFVSRQATIVNSNVDEIRVRLGLSAQVLSLSIDNLLRLRLLTDRPGSNSVRRAFRDLPELDRPSISSTPMNVSPSTFGSYFLVACTAPAA